MILVNSAGCTCLRVGCNRTYLLEGKFLSCVRGSLRDHSGHYQSTWVVSPNPQPSQENASGSCHAAIRVGMPDERIFAILGLPKLEKEMATHSSILAWRIPGMAEPGGLPSMRSHRVGHDWSDLAAAAASCQQGKNLIAFKSQKSIKWLMFLSCVCYPTTLTGFSFSWKQLLKQEVRWASRWGCSQEKSVLVFSGILLSADRRENAPEKKFTLF